MEKRIKGMKCSIDYSATSAFFAGRAAKYSAQTPYVSTSFQDKAPDLAMARDIHEKQLVMPFLNINFSSRVIDIGCGVGRWADSIIPLAGSYLGLDFCPELIQVAKSRFKGSKQKCDHAFKTCSFQDLSQLELTTNFTHGLVSGVMAYINDDELLKALQAMAELMEHQSIIYFREPVAFDDRLTLDKFFSTDMETEYSAIYRPLDEYRNLLQQVFSMRGYRVIREGFMLTEQLANRRETGPYYFILER